MTNKEAIDMLTSIRDYLCNGNPIWKTEPIRDAVNMAIDALRKTEPNCLEKPNNSTISKMEQVEKPQTCSVNGRPYDCGNCEYFRCTADEPQTERSE